MKRLLKEFEGLPRNPRTTAEAWLKWNPSLLMSLMSWYSQAYREEHPKRGWRPAPSQIDRKLRALEHAFRNLANALENQSSPLQGALAEAEIDMSAWGPSRRKELRGVEESIKALRERPNFNPPPLTQRLVNAVAAIVGRDLSGKKSHVLPIAQSIHRWATRDPNAEFLGETYLDNAWKRVAVKK